MSSPSFPNATTAQPFSTVASAPIFVVSSNIQITGGYQLQNIAFQELAGINSEINIEQYVSVDAAGFVNHTKQFGLTRPPTVTLKRGLDNSLTLWAWHQMALGGDPGARAQYLSLDIFGGGRGSIQHQQPLMSYTLINAWCAKINISSARAGEGVVTEDVTIACDMITQGDGGG
ncbi:phage tail protein [Streptacidiphilus sp. PB12-B1b]|uniref:phage tail protein n=1 Tax=Streptacidiphilus sp. PB12-B1b TaxID=2705012 RepID=UPI0015F9B030|nr:phage tail protein [Streptacidiphilus sp. PB12-B1b]QMU78002.1 phage tail protein [Streptacidiphilus sp. PB12-B1b]